MKKKLVGLLLLIMICASNVNCSKTAIKENKTVFWGSTDEVINFLQSDKAIANRWLVESLGM